MEKNNFIYLFFLISFFSHLQSQVNLALPDITPSSPSTDGFKKFENFPVDYHTGLPAIDYDIFKIKIDGINIPIKLSYHASGIRVNERASKVGIGWNLLIGGAITRQVRGMPDDYEGGGYIRKSANNDIGKFFSIVNRYGNNYYSIPSGSDRDYYKKFNENALNGYIDTEPDIFSFNILGLSGKFVFSQRGEIIMLNKQDVLVEKKINNGLISSFTITDSQGNKFFFNSNDSETTEVLPKTWSSEESMLGEDYMYTSSWKLSKISTNKGNYINLYYINGGNQGESVVEDITFKYDCDAQGGAIPQDCNTFTRTFFGSHYDINEKLISKIEFSGGKIYFNYDSYTYSDMLNKRMSSITIKDSNDKIIQHEKLTHSVLNNKVGTRRLTLNSIQKIKDNKLLPPTEFEYYQAGVFPEYSSKSVDLWGYYNGKINYSLINFSDIPDYLKSYGGAAIQNKLANRNPAFDETIKGVLKEVIYPSGGRTHYIYEKNDYGYINNRPAVPSTNNSYKTKQVTNVSSCSDLYGSNDSGCTNSSNLISKCKNNVFEADNNYVSDPSGEHIKTFTAPNSYGNYFFIYANLDGSGDSTGSGVQLSDDKGNIIYSYKNNNTPEYPSKVDPIISISDSRDGDPNIIKLIPGNNYTIRANTEDDCRASFISVHKLVVDKEQTYQNPTVGGLRVKEILKYDSNNTLLLRRSYDYKIVEDSIRSSGVVKTKHRNKTREKEYNTLFVTGNGIGCKYPLKYKKWSIYSIPQKNFGNSKKMHITYRRVLENIHDYKNNKTQKIIYNYTSPYDYYKDDKVFTEATRIDNDYRMGLNFRTEFKNDLGITVKTDSIGFKYVNSDTPAVLGMAFYCNVYDVFKYGCNTTSIKPSLTGFSHDLYKHSKLTTSLLNHKIETINSENIKFEKLYEYDNPNSSLLTKTIILGSQGDTLKTKIYYPDDKLELSNLDTESSIAIDTLKLQHRIGEPIQTDTYKNGVLLSSQRTDYKKWENGIVLPKELKTLKGIQSSTNKLEERITYHAYDDKGNPIDVGKSGGSRVIYVWGYNKSYPIVKIEGVPMSYKSIDDELKQLRGVNFTTLQRLSNEDTNLITEQNLRDSYKSLYTALKSLYPTAQLTTYTYDPLIGVTSITDPRQETIYYAYDDFNRLEYVKDSNKNILKEYKYNYKKQ